MTARTLYQKVWDAHVVQQDPDCPAVLYVDLHLIHEGSSPQAFAALRERGLRVRRPDLALATTDHLVPTLRRADTPLDPKARVQIEALVSNARSAGIRALDDESGLQGIVHVIGPEMGLTHPGDTVVCGDSHTSTHGAFGALAFGIGTTEIIDVLATQCLLQRPSKTFRVDLEGPMPRGCGSKDVMLALLAKIGVNAGTGHVFEFAGSSVRSMTMEQRMTLCNMSVEGGARAGMIAPDDVTFQYLHGREGAPQAEAWDAAVRRWRFLPTDEGAVFDRTTHLDVGDLVPMVTYGTSPGMAAPVSGPVPSPSDALSAEAGAAMEKALQYMALRPGQPIAGLPIDVVFIGSCTNSRISDLRAAASILQGRRVKTRTLVVPGSRRVQREAEAEGLAEAFRQAGCEWRDPGCSMCLAMNGDEVPPGAYCVSTSNRNFEGRQGPGARTLLASPLTAAASALAGALEDPRKWIP